MGRAAVLVQNLALVPRDVRRGQPEHSVPLETEHANNSTAGEEDFAVTRRHDTSCGCPASCASLR